MFTSTCRVCCSSISTRTDQSTNPNFRCKPCNTKISTEKQQVSFDKKFGPKIIHSWLSNTIFSSLFPSKWSMNDIRCDKCYKRFYSQNLSDYCPKCSYQIVTDMTCTKCNKIEKITPASFKKHDNMCISCYNSVQRLFKCTYCKNTFVDTHNTFNTFNDSVCVDCRKSSYSFKNKLLLNYAKNHNQIIDTILDIHDKYTINVNYIVSYIRTTCDSDIETSGYYSDPYYDNFVYKTYTQQFPLLKMFEFTDDYLKNPDFIKYYQYDRNTIQTGKKLDDNYYIFSVKIKSVETNIDV